MAQVYLARTDTDQPRLVAIKTLEITALDDPDRTAMFADEMRIARLLRHPNIVELVEAGVIGDVPFLVLEFIDGPSFRDLANWCEQRGRGLEPRLVLSLMVGACMGLHYAHELCSEWGTPLRLVHRDISPQNLMVTRKGVLKVLDFGVAKAVGQRHQTIAQGVKGKMAYTAPEYVRGGTPDRRADIFGLGVVLWELLTNSRLFFRATVVGTMQAVVYDEVPPPSSINPLVPEALEQVVMSALERDLDQRWPTAQAMGEAMLGVAGELGGVMSPQQIAEALSAAFSDVMVSREELTPRMSDLQLSRGATRPSLNAVAAPEDSNPSKESWSSEEVDLSALEQELRFEMDFEDSTGSGTVVDIRPAWMDDEES